MFTDSSKIGDFVPKLFCLGCWMSNLGCQMSDVKSGMSDVRWLALKPDWHLYSKL